MIYTKLKITYRKSAKPIFLQTDEKNIVGIAEDCASKLTKNYQAWRIKQGNPMTRISMKKYEIGQKYMILQKLEEMI